MPPKRKAAVKANTAVKEESKIEIVISDDEDEPPPKPKKAKSEKSAGKQKAKTEKKVTPADDGAEEEVLIGHIISKCVGIQHYNPPGSRYNKEPFRLKRQPNNPYDANAVAVHHLKSDKQVGHVQRIDAIAIADVADDRSMQIKMVGQLESGAGQMYKFPLRISFFGQPDDKAKVASILGRNGINLVEPKKRKPKKKPAPKKSAKKSQAAAMEAVEEESDDEVECVGEKTWAERDAELRAQAVVLE